MLQMGENSTHENDTGAGGVGLGLAHSMRKGAWRVGAKVVAVRVHLVVRCSSWALLSRNRGESAPRTASLVRRRHVLKRSLGLETAEPLTERGARGGSAGYVLGDSVSTLAIRRMN